METHHDSLSGAQDSPHVNANTTFPSLVSCVARQWRRALDAELQPLGLTEATWRALLHASRAAAPLHQKDLARTMGLDSSSVVRLLVTLERDGHIVRVEDADDKRVKRILLTESGRALSLRVESIAGEVRARLLGGLPEDELALAMKVLRQVSATLAANNSDPQS